MNTRKRSAIFSMAIASALSIAASPANSANFVAADSMYYYVAQTTAPTTQEVEELSAEITGVEGMVQVRASENEKWTKATVGMKFSKANMVEFRTGPKSSVRCLIGPDQTFVLDRLGTVKLLDAYLDSDKITTDLMMKYGRVRLDVETAGVEHRSVIRSPTSTLAVRGTKVSLYDQRPYVPEAVSLTGTAEYRDGKKQILFGKSNQGKTKVNSEKENAAELTIETNTVDPNASLARSASETQLVDNLISKGATVTFDRTANIKVITGGRPLTDSQLIPTLPGSLTFVARWFTNADLNFSIGTPGGKNNAGEILYPTGALARNSSGGVVPFDHRGGPNGGMEVVYFPKGFPTGLYGMGLTLISGEPTSAQVDVFQNGKRIGFFDGQGTVTTATVEVPKPTPGFVDGTAVGVVPIGVDLPSRRAKDVSVKRATRR